jgi:hypothetical protein
MSNAAFRNTRHARSEAARRVEHLWDSADNPILVCSLRIDHAITQAREEVDVVMTGARTTIHHRSCNPLISRRK